MSLKEIMGILVASMLVFLPFAVLFNPVLLKKYKGYKNEKEGMPENSTNEQNDNNNSDNNQSYNVEQNDNNQAYSVEKFSSNETENK